MVIDSTFAWQFLHLPLGWQRVKLSVLCHWDLCIKTVIEKEGKTEFRLGTANSYIVNRCQFITSHSKIVEDGFTSAYLLTVSKSLADRNSEYSTPAVKTVNPGVQCMLH